MLTNSEFEDSMAQSLIIVESPSKVKTISKYVGNNYKIVATAGHIKDLPKKKLGVDVKNDFTPDYLTIPGKEKILKHLVSEAAKAENILIATDPDREGEAIAWHIAQEVQSKKNNIYRILINEITKKGITEGLGSLGSINNDLVQAQQARRVMDRLVGYQVSPFLWKTLARGLSAGRVQSVVLRLICERENKIDSFVPQEYWTISASFSKEGSDPFLAKLVQFEGKKIEPPDGTAAQNHVNAIQQQKYFITDIRKKEVSRSPYPPFITSTLQQEASKRFGMSTSRVMVIAQQLYEGVDLGPEETVGLITYMRTDSVRISTEALTQARTFIGSVFGAEYLPENARMYKSKKSAQDAHEAIRPTDIQRTPESIEKYLNKDQLKVYELIWNRFLASQMSDARFLQTQVDITGGSYLFRVTGSIMRFAGFLRLFVDSTEDEQEEEQEGKIPENFQVHDALQLMSVNPEQHFTKPPAHYSESSLVKELDAQGIGRPSTYAPIISNIITRKYIEKKDRRLMPTDLGKAVNKILTASFPDLFNVKFTSLMEEELDKIESGNKSSTSVLEEFYEPFEKSLEDVNARRKEIKQTLEEGTDLTCELCSKPLVLKWGRHGRFYACSGYPDCKNTKPYNGNKEENEPQTLDEKCPECAAALVVRNSRYGSKFIACSSYPKCKYTRSLSTGVKCPKEECGGDIIQRHSKKGRTFYGCSNYPKCDFVSWYPIVNNPCTNCGSPFLEMKKTKQRGEHFYCSKCKTVIEKTVESEA